MGKRENKGRKREKLIEIVFKVATSDARGAITLNLDGSGSKTVNFFCKKHQIINCKNVHDKRDIGLKPEIFKKNNKNKNIRKISRFLFFRFPVCGQYQVQL